MQTTTTGTQRDPHDLLEDLIRLDYDAIEAYDAAIERLDDNEIRTMLMEFRDDHYRHTENLGRFLRSEGKVPPTGPGAKRLLTKGKVVLANLAGDQAVLKAMKSNEDDTNAAYERAVQHDGLSFELKEILRNNLADERRHRAWLEQNISDLS